MVRLFILAGQSNMVGAGVTAELPEKFRTTPPNMRLSEGGEWRELLWHDRFGPELGFGRAVSEALPDDEVVLLKVARSGANLYYDWNPDGVSKGPEDTYRGPLYPVLMSQLEALKNELAEAHQFVELSAMLWMQGERDSVIEVMADTYEANLTAFIKQVRRDTGHGTLPFLLGQIAPRCYLMDEQKFRHEFRERVQEAQRRVADADPWAEFVRSADLPQSDNLHFDTAGQVELGRRFARAYLSKAG